MVEVAQKLGRKQAEGAWGNKDLEIALDSPSSSPPSPKNMWNCGIKNPSIFIYCRAYRLHLLPAVGSLGRQNRRKLVFSLCLEVGRAELGAPLPFLGSAPLELGWEAAMEPAAWPGHPESLACPFSSSPACARDGLLGTGLGPTNTWGHVQAPTWHFPV